MTKKHQIRLLILMACHRAAPRADTIPPPLLPWVQWVSQDTCPPQYNQSPEKGKGICRWPSQYAHCRQWLRF